MPGRVVVGVSLKMYFRHRQAQEWFSRVRDIASTHSAIAGGLVELFVIPTFLQVLPAIEAFAATPVMVGAQDLATEDVGAYTGEVSGAELAEVGVRVAETGHAERRRLFGETDAVVAAKTAAALRHGLVPVICVGEAAPRDAAEASAEAIRQLTAALRGAPRGRVLVAYEPVWAIGAREPAAVSQIRTVGTQLRRTLGELTGREGSGVLYGGSAQLGLLTALQGSVDGIFLGRFAHDSSALAAVIDEAAALAERLEVAPG